MEDWDEHKVSKFVGSVGNGKVWLQYAKKCLEDGIDGQTLVSVDVGDLIEMGFTKPHAKAVLSARDLSNSVKVVIPNANSVVTEAELAEMQRLACHRELLGQSASQISLALEGLMARVRGHHTQVDQTVDETIAKWEQARVCAHAKLDIDQAKAKQQLEQALANITENQRTFEATSSQAAMLCSAPIHVTDATALKQRQAQITTLTQECLGSPFTALAREPEWRVDYVNMPAGKLLVDVVSFPCTTVARYALPPLSVSVEAMSTSAEANWSLPAEYPVGDAKFQYRVQLACSGVRPEGAPPPYDEKEDSGEEYQDVYRGEGRCCSLRSLNVATSFCLRVRLENGSVCGKWNSATFCTLRVPPGRKMFDVPGSIKWVVPAGVTEIDAIVIGGGGAGLASGFVGKSGTLSRLGGVVSNGGEGGIRGQVARGGSGSFKSGGSGALATNPFTGGAGGGAAGGENGHASKGGLTYLKYAGSGGNGSATPRQWNQLANGKDPYQGAKYGGGGGAGVSGGGGGGYSLVHLAVVPGTSIDIEVGQGGDAETPFGGANGLVVIAWGGEEV